MIAFSCIEAAFGCIGAAFGCIGAAFGCTGAAFGCIGAACGCIDEKVTVCDACGADLGPKSAFATPVERFLVQHVVKT